VLWGSRVLAWLNKSVEQTNQSRSAATILSLLEEGTFDYGSIFTDQAPLHDFDFGSGVVPSPGT
jgi:hypothetical protein